MVNTTQSKTSYKCNGVLKAFDFPFPIFEKTDIVVIITDKEGTETPLNYITDYTVSAANDDFSSGGTVTTVETYPADYIITIMRIVELTQESNYTENESFPAEVFEADLDKIMMAIQQLEERIDRILKVPVSDEEASLDLPTVTQRANRFLGFNENGDPIAAETVTGAFVTAFMETVLDDDTPEAARSTLSVYSKSEIDSTINYLCRFIAALVVETWATRVSAADNDWQSVCYSPELELFCAVSSSGTGNRVMTSPDGITWTIRASASNSSWQSVCWAPEPGLFCAVGPNAVMTSLDGITWISRTPAAAEDWRSVCWSSEQELFCAVSTDDYGNSAVMTSPDGINWTGRTPASSHDWFSVCWAPGPGLFCAVGGAAVMTSPDGITWTSRTPASSDYWQSVCWSPELELFCAVSSSGTGNRVMTSPDGITWTIRVSAADNNWFSVCWSSELRNFCAVSADGTGNRVMTSPDGINWIIRPSAIDNNWQSVCWAPGPGLFCAVASTGTGDRVMTTIIV